MNHQYQENSAKSAHPSSQLTGKEPSPAYFPTILRHSSDELALAEKCIKKLVVDSQFFPSSGAAECWFSTSHSDSESNDQIHPHEASTTVTALFEDELRVGELLGTGGFCQVRMVRLEENNERVAFQHKQRQLLSEVDEDPSMRQYAIKYLRPNIKQKGRKAFSRGAADLAIEARFLSLLSHENIITLHYVSAGTLQETYNCSEDSSGDSNEMSLRKFGYFLVLDYLHGTLDQRVEDTYVPQVTKLLGEHPNKHHEHHQCDTRHHSFSFGLHRLDQNHSHRWHFSARRHRVQNTNVQALQRLLAQRLTVLKSIASALHYLHEKNIIFRDIKPNNIGFFNNEREEIPKLFDFGLVKEMKQSSKAWYDHDCHPVYKLTGRTGSRRYMSPEVAFSQPYNEKADVYSFGILLYEISSLVHPFEGWTFDAHEEQVLKKHHRPCLIGYTYWPKQLSRLISDCWEAVMWKRPDMAEVCRRLDDCIEVLITGSDVSVVDHSNKCGKDGHESRSKLKQYFSSAVPVLHMHRHQ